MISKTKLGVAYWTLVWGVSVLHAPSFILALFILNIHTSFFREFPEGLAGLTFELLPVAIFQTLWGFWYFRYYLQQPNSQ